MGSARRRQSVVARIGRAICQRYGAALLRGAAPEL